ncbi:zinc finger protein 362-like isoform 2-T2 [Salvelinus alpinus]
MWDLHQDCWKIIPVSETTQQRQALQVSKLLPCLLGLSLQIHLSAHAIKNAKAYCCSMCGRDYTSETYLMKHMSKHMVVEHLVSHHSPQRTESPNIPIRISLI